MEIKLEIESRAQRVFRLCGAMERALVERRGLRPEKAHEKVAWVQAMQKLDSQEIELSYLAKRFDLLDVISE